MIKKAFVFPCFLVALVMSGLPLGIIQMGAWVSMFDEFYQETELVRLSVEWTLNGDRPCNVCNFVNEQSKSEKQDLKALEIFSSKLNLVSEVTEIIHSHSLKIVGQLTPVSEQPCSTYLPLELPPPRTIA